MVQAHSPRADVLTDHLQRIHAATGVPVVLQDYPVVSGVTVTPAALLEVVRACPFVVAVKAESTPTAPSVAALTAGTDLPVFGGLGGVGLIDELACGAAGAMTGFSHPEALRAALDAYAAGGFAAAREAWAPWLPLANFEGQAAIGLALRKEILHRRGILDTPRSGRPPRGAAAPAAGARPAPGHSPVVHIAAGGLMELGLVDKVAVVLGATSGLGRATAEALAAEGARVVVVGRRKELVDELAASLPSAVGVVADLTDPDAPARIAEAAREAFGPVDVLVLNGGGPAPGAAPDLTADGARAAADLLLTPHVAMVQQVLPGMRERGWGRILAIGSSGVQQPIPTLAASNVGRAALAAYLKTLAGVGRPRRRDREHGAPRTHRHRPGRLAGRRGGRAHRQGRRGGPRRVRGSDPRRSVRRTGRSSRPS